MLRTFRQFLTWREGDAIILAEANVLPGTDMEYFGKEGERLQMMFNFEVNQNLVLRAGQRRYATTGQGDAGDEAAAGYSPVGTAFYATTMNWIWAVLTKEQRRVSSQRSARTEHAAVRPRNSADALRPCLQGDRRRLELAYSLMLTLPGTPVIRYGDEIGMGDNLRLPERNCARTPMQWSTEPQGGFTKSEKPVLPVITDGAYGFQHVNVAQPEARPEFATELDGTNDPHAQGGAGNRLGRLYLSQYPVDHRFGDALRLEKQCSGLPS